MSFGKVEVSQARHICLSTDTENIHHRSDKMRSLQQLAFCRKSENSKMSSSWSCSLGYQDRQIYRQRRNGTSLVLRLLAVDVFEQSRAGHSALTSSDTLRPSGSEKMNIIIRLYILVRA